MVGGKEVGPSGTGVAEMWQNLKCHPIRKAVLSFNKTPDKRVNPQSEETPLTRKWFLDGLG